MSRGAGGVPSGSLSVRAEKTMHRRQFIAALAAASATPAFGAQASGFADTAVIQNRVHLVGAQLLGTPVRAIVDTGARISTVSESLAARVGIEAVGSRRLNTVHREIRVGLARNLAFEVPGFAYQTGRWAIMPDTLQPGLDCVVETGALGDFNLSFSTHTLSQGLKAEHMASLQVRRSSIPLAEFSVHDHTLTMALDTGADISWIDPGLARSLLTQPGAAAATFMTANGPVLRALRLPRMMCGDAEFSEVLLRVRERDRNLQIRGSKVAGLLGTNVMQSYDWSFSRGYREVRRGIAFLGRTEWFGLGVDFRVDSQDPGRIVALAVGGPAERAGLSVGDRILTLNGISADPAGDEAMRSAGVCDCVETVAVRYVPAGATSPEAVSITTAPMV